MKVNLVGIEGVPKDGHVNITLELVGTGTGAQKFASFKIPVEIGFNPTIQELGKSALIKLANELTEARDHAFSLAEEIYQEWPVGGKP